MNHKSPAVASAPTIRPVGSEPDLRYKATAVSQSPKEGASYFTGFTISARTPQGRILIAVTQRALAKLHQPEREPTLLTTLSRHAPRFQALAIQMACRDGASHVTIDADSVWWSGDDGV
jgi:hypothetical protein